MAKRPQRKKVRVELRKNQQTRTRQNNFTKQFESKELNEDELTAGERLTGKGALTRKRTIISEGEATADGDSAHFALDLENCQRGRVLTARGLSSVVQAEDGTIFQCATRRLLKSLDSDERHVIVTGDRIWFRTVNEQEGMIERIEPRKGLLCRNSQGRRHILAANVQQLLIVVSAAEPQLKPNLIDRMLISAEQGRLPAIICINKSDLIDPAELQPLLGVYSQLGYQVLLLSARTGRGVDRLKKILAGKETAVAGQSGVGKSSLLNVVEPGLGLKVSTVSEENQKGRHTTTSATLYPLSQGGWIVDTPGIRQFELWSLQAAEIAGYFREFRPFLNRCRFPNCTHSHEADCAIKDAVADQYLDARRYESYLHLLDARLI